MNEFRQARNRFRAWNSNRKDRNTIRRFQNNPSKFLREHTVNTMWGENPANPQASNPNQAFQLVEQANANPARRPGRVLGNLRTHRVKNFVLTQDPQVANAVGRTVGAFNAAHLSVAQAHNDAVPNLGAGGPLQGSRLDIAPVPIGGNVFTMDLSGCTIKRNNANLHHVMPQANGANLQAGLGGQTFGSNDYGDNQAFVMFRKKANGLKLYSQTQTQAGLPVMNKRRFR